MIFKKILFILFFSFLFTQSIFANNNCSDIKVGNQIWAGCNSNMNAQMYYPGKDSNSVDNNGNIIGAIYEKDYAYNNKVCNDGYRLPTLEEFETAVKISGSYTNLVDDLKLVYGGTRYRNKTIYNEFGDYGYLLLQNKKFINFKKKKYIVRNDDLATAFSVRCIKFDSSSKNISNNLGGTINNNTNNNLGGTINNNNGNSSNTNSNVVNNSDIITNNDKILNSNINGILYTRGDFATTNSKDYDWIKKFKIIEVGDIADSNKIFFYIKSNRNDYEVYGYDWMPADYHYISGSGDRPFVKWMLENKNDRTLNPNGPFPHCNRNYNWCNEYYYNFGNSEVLNKRVKTVLNQISKNGYDGVFFDWASFNPKRDPENASINNNWNSKYPNILYIDKIREYYKKLKENKTKVITNQAFRSAGKLLDLVDYDMTESYAFMDGTGNKIINIKGKGITKVKVTKYFSMITNEFNSNKTSRELFKDTFHYLGILQEKKKKYITNTKFKYIYMNYAAPEYEYIGGGVYKEESPKNAINFGYAFAKLVGSYEFTEVPVNHSVEVNNIYFYYLGNILGKTYEKLPITDADIYVRYYDNSIVLAGYTDKEITITLDSNFIKSNSKIYDTYNNKWLDITNNKLQFTIKPYFDPILNKNTPFGRILVYKNYSGKNNSNLDNSKVDTNQNNNAINKNSNISDPLGTILNENSYNKKNVWENKIILLEWNNLDINLLGKYQKYYNMFKKFFNIKKVKILKKSDYQTIKYYNNLKIFNFYTNKLFKDLNNKFYVRKLWYIEILKKSIYVLKNIK